jgi:hypothetical protein
MTTASAQQYTQEQVDRAKPKGFFLEVKQGEAWVKPPNDLKFFRVASQKRVAIKAGTLVNVRRGFGLHDPRVIFGASDSIRDEIHGEVSFVAAMDVFTRPQWFRTNIETGDFSTLAVDVAKIRNRDRTLKQIVPAQASLPEKITKRGRSGEQQIIIVPHYPDARFVVEVIEFPVSVDFAWPTVPPQKNPHNFYLWESGTVALSPFDTSATGKMTVSFGRYGSYFWQVEDAPGIFASAPREVVIRPPDSVSKAKVPADLSLIKIERPKNGSLIVGCSEGGSVETMMIVDAQGMNAHRLSIEARPADRLVRYDVLPRNLQRTKDVSDRIAIRLQLLGETNLQVRVLAYNDGERLKSQLVAVSEWISLAIKDRCNSDDRSKAAQEAAPGFMSTPDEGSILIQ